MMKALKKMMGILLLSSFPGLEPAGSEISSHEKTPDNRPDALSEGKEQPQIVIEESVEDRRYLRRKKVWVPFSNIEKKIVLDANETL